MIDLTALLHLPDHADIDRAIAFARKAHVGQVRKYTGEQYYTHPVEVARIFLSLYGGQHDDTLVPSLIAAILHDTVEDTPVTIEDIRGEFGDEVARLVDGLTDVSMPEDGNRATRKRMDREHTLSACPLTMSIKCCDLISNTYSIVEHDRDFARVYLKEKKLILDGMSYLDDGPDSACYKMAVMVMMDGFRQLEKTDA